MVKRITREEALELFQKAPLWELGKKAHQTRKKIHPDKIVSFVVDRNVNYTNICISQCRFCAFSRPPGHKEGYVLSETEVLNKIKELVEQGGTQLLLQGGINPALSLAYFENLFKKIKAVYDVHIHSLSPPEIFHLAKKENMSIRKVLEKLKSAGLDSIAGGGAEILSDRVRGIISPNKISSYQWLSVMKQAHKIGLFSSATMMFGTIENDEEIIDHLILIRELQDETKGFISFIPWSYQPANTLLGGKEASAVKYLRVLAISRLVLDNIENIQASWVTQGDKIAQLALFFGANDLGGTMMEENVVRSAGACFKMSKEELIHIIKDAGFIPAQRNTKYRILRKFS